MMGIEEQRLFSLLPRDVSLEELRPEHNYYRCMEETLGLSIIRKLDCSPNDVRDEFPRRSRCSES